MHSSGAKRILRNYLWYFSAWTVVGIFFFSQALVQKVISREPTPWQHYLTSWLVGVYLWALLTPLVFWLGRRLPIERPNWARRIAVHLPISAALSFGQLFVESILLYRLHVFPSFMTGLAPTFVFLLTIGFHQGIMTYFVLLGGQYGLDYYHKYLEREKQALRLEVHAAQLKTQLADARLSALKMQLQPHFLFNTLNAIMVLVRQQKGRQAEEMLARLGDLLRCVLEDVDEQRCGEERQRCHRHGHHLVHGQDPALQLRADLDLDDLLINKPELFRVLRSQMDMTLGDHDALVYLDLAIWPDQLAAGRACDIAAFADGCFETQRSCV